ncbi:hypothetical protein [Herminiimonas fonticola]|uniref:hypothetical protein n=1 Tax=Herminiimonas fonticola TaxID=303380 RepID=UPI003340602E
MQRQNLLPSNNDMRSVHIGKSSAPGLKVVPDSKYFLLKSCAAPRHGATETLFLCPSSIWASSTQTKMPFSGTLNGMENVHRF